MNGFYTILNVTKNATQDDIKKSYRQLSRKHHPDKNNGIDTMMKKITEAYTVLSDTSKRKEYDMASSMGNPEELINLIFNQGGFSFFHNINTNQNMFRNFVRLLVHTVYVTLSDIYNENVIPTIINRDVISNNIKNTVQEEIKVKIPNNILDNMSIILPNNGNIINNNKGDLKIKFSIIDDSTFFLNNNDVYYNKSISLKEALCGFNFKLHYIDHKTYNINNSNTIIYPNYKKTVNNIGLLKNGKRGKLVITFSIKFPETLSNESKKMIGEVL